MENLEKHHEHEQEQRPKVFLYFQTGVNDDLTSAAREELTKEKVPFHEIDLTKHKLDNEWPALPVISSIEGFYGNFTDRTDVINHVQCISEGARARRLSEYYSSLDSK